MRHHGGSTEGAPAAGQPDGCFDDPLLLPLPLIDGFRLLGPCLLFGRLGEGGMGQVFRGLHVPFELDVAVKCVQGHLAALGADFLSRFRREARVAARLTHENLVRVYDTGVVRGVHYLVMELVDGETARQRLRRKGRLTVAEAVTIVRDAARGLALAHREGVVHRDVKPDNLLVRRDGVVKVADLGLVSSREPDTVLSLPRRVMGTPDYMPPEQFRDFTSVTPATDVWALGATLFHLLSGRRPFEELRGAEAIGAQVCDQGFPAVDELLPDLPAELRAVVTRATTRDPRERFADAGELAVALSRVLEASGAGAACELAEPGLVVEPATHERTPTHDTVVRARRFLESDAGAQGVESFVAAAPAAGRMRGTASARTGPSTALGLPPRVRLALAIAAALALGIAGWQAATGELRETPAKPSAPDTSTGSESDSVSGSVSGPASGSTSVSDSASVSASVPVSDSASVSDSVSDPGPVSDPGLASDSARAPPESASPPSLTARLLSWPGFSPIEDEQPTVLAWAEDASQQFVLVERDGELPFLIGRTEVSVGQYLRFCDATERRPPALDFGRREHGAPYRERADLPVVMVTAADARAFCAWLGEQLGLPGRLPDVERWLAAARQDPADRHPWGSLSPLGKHDYANFNGLAIAPAPLELDEAAILEARRADGHAAACAVDFRYPNGKGPFGALHQCGNVAEWCDGPPGSGELFALGGSFHSNLRELDLSAPAPQRREGEAADDVGFRVLLEAPP